MRLPFALQEGEKVSTVFRRQTMYYGPRLVFAACFILIPFFFLFALLAWGVLGTIVFTVFVGYGSWTAWTIFRSWERDGIYVTSARVICVRTKRKKLSSEVLAWQKEDVARVEWYRKGFMGFVCGYGTILLSSVDNKTIGLAGLPKPEQTVEMIKQMLSEAKRTA